MALAKLKEDWPTHYYNFWQNHDEATAYMSEIDFVELRKRIARQKNIIEVKFTVGDAFEAEDDNIWLPDCCFQLLPIVTNTQEGADHE